MNKSPMSLFFVRSLICYIAATSSQGVFSADFNWILDSGTSNWTTLGNWSPAPPSGGPTAADNIDMQINGGTTTNMSIGGTREANNLTKTGSKRWDIVGNGATLNTLTLNSISIATANMAFRDGSSGGGLQVNATNVNLSTGGTLFFGITSLSTTSLLRGLTVSGSTTVTGGSMYVNISNPSDSFSLGLLNVSGSGIVNLNNAPTGKDAVTANVTGLNGSGGFVQTNPTVAQAGNIATLSISNDVDYSSSTVLRDGANTALVGTLSLSKNGAGTQTLSGNNSFTGSTNITNGILKIGHASALGGQVGISAINTDNGTRVSAAGTLDLGGQTGVIEVIRLNGTGFGGNGALINSGLAASIGSGVASITQTTAGTGAMPILTISGGGGQEPRRRSFPKASPAPALPSVAAPLFTRRPPP